ncbi:MAG: cation-translocating P-type ATPase [Oscillospiraceae bacterium]|nr:cation-translocating P-type ATPase [Oscillospiraceae bacterium]
MNEGYHAKSIELSLLELKVDAVNGLPAAEAQKRLAQNGANRLQSARSKPLGLKILEQFRDFLVIILIIAAIISIAAGDGLKDAIIIFCILIINMVIGLVQENKADNALKELKNMSSPKAKVKRDGRIGQIGSEDVVVGDIILLDAGDFIPADVRLIESSSLRIDEAALTGESVSVEKDADVVLKNDVSLGDKINLASMGTVVTYGRGMGVVTAAGMDTEIGKIAALINETGEAATPLQGKLNSMAKTLGIVCVATCALVFGIGFLYNQLNLGDPRDIIEMLMVSVSLAVAAVPEGVAIVATVILAVGVQRMVKRNVIVKKLRAVETLGSTTVICSDKTGTLTQNKMTVVKVYDAVNVFDVTGTGYGAAGEVVTNGRPLTQNIPLMAAIGVLCNDAVYDRETAKIIGDPTEAAMLVFGAKLKLDKDKLNAKVKRIGEKPFDSERKLMSTRNIKDGKTVMNVKGAPDAVLARSDKVFLDGEITPMTENLRARLSEQNERFAAQALRVLAFAYKEMDNETDETEDGLTYVGQMCMIDPPRDEVKASVEQCREAGINIKMITGDHKTTAVVIAQTLGIAGEDGEALDGNDLDQLSDEQLREKVKTVNVFARVSPEHKVRIVAALKENNNIVAMTGDGVNDAPSLKKADIGIAMGITGTDVSKEAADMILTDDNFVSIAGAVEQGRTIYGNIRKVTGYLLSCNIGEILIIFLAIVFGLPVPLLATQLLFVNLLTDALPAFALGMERKERGVMKRRPRDPQEPLINKGMKGSVAFRAAFVCAGSLGAFLYGLHHHDYATAVSMCFFTLVASELLVSYPSRTEEVMGFSWEIFKNKFLNISMALSFAVLVAVMYIPVCNQLFTTVPLSLPQFGVSMALVLVPVFGSELSKRIFSIR